jgi:hypothetical protein
MVEILHTLINTNELIQDSIFLFKFRIKINYVHKYKSCNPTLVAVVPVLTSTDNDRGELLPQTVKFCPAFERETTWESDQKLGS